MAIYVLSFNNSESLQGESKRAIPILVFLKPHLPLMLVSPFSSHLIGIVKRKSVETNNPSVFAKMLQK